MSDLRLYLLTLFSCLMFIGCAAPMPWPTSPLYPLPEVAPDAKPERSEAQVMAALVGRYAHYDVVAYEQTDSRKPMRTFIVSYGFTELFIDNGQLFERDQFCHASHHLNYTTVTSKFSDQATQAIIPPVQAIELSWQDGLWQLFRKATPSLLGITGDPSLPLSKDPDDLRIIDPDGDGKPGVTVELTIAERWQEEIYLIRREIFNNLMWWYPDGSLRGYVFDESEQTVIGASVFYLNRHADPTQHPDPAMSPIWLTPLSAEIENCAQLMAQRDTLFPAEPVFSESK